MNNPLIFLLLLCCTMSEMAAQYQVGHRQQTFTDAARANRSISTEIYYPATTAGNNVAVASGAFPLLIFGHGFVMTTDAYLTLADSLATKGYIVVLPNSEGSFSPSHSNFGLDLSFLLHAMQAEGSNAASPFYNAVGATSAAMGHSMGGGASFLAAGGDTSFTAIATLAAAVTNPSSVTAARNVRIPAVVFAGANDCVAPPAQHQTLMYDSLASTCKTYITVTGGSHCQFADANTFCSIGEATCSPGPTISRATQLNTTLSLLTPWLDYYLKNDTTAGNNFQDLIEASTAVTFVQTCSLRQPTLPSSLNYVAGEESLLIAPNPIVQNAWIESKTPLESATLLVYNAMGQEVHRVENLSGNRFLFERGTLSSGFYVVGILQKGQISMLTKISLY